MSLRVALALSAVLLSACSEDSVNLRMVAPALSPATIDLEAALSCPANADLSHQPVLLVHGTGADASIWQLNYVPLLSSRGFDVCTVTLPFHSWGDIQSATEYVVHAIRVMAARYDQKVALIGHSQGAAEMVWAIKWWPDIGPLISDYIALAGANHGAPIADQVCILGICPPAAWQLKPGSQFFATMNADDETPGALPYSSIYSETDTTAVAPTSVIGGASNIAVQQLCPGRQVGHAQMLSDAVAFALVMDALTHPGPASPDRIDPAVCAEDRAPGLDPQQAQLDEQVGLALFLRTSAEAGLVAAEPPLRAYAVKSSTSQAR